eukprot:CAMPEP_0119564398 /NCGR_PEP_ID=MMETSP1352-20130426/26849_1 /TAXON_ID=265584 /ORGANISM="Stauroneis constricta, Strain CCMP1120" /LENGTH=283 /DNA_ID=CAMNT_0007613155 /DNA_START=280 /DNA_END=1128 /DNA_ORIENTATION=-
MQQQQPSPTTPRQQPQHHHAGAKPPAHRLRMSGTMKVAPVPVASRPASGMSSKNFRSRYLNRLGIPPRTPPSSHSYPQPRCNPPTRSTTPHHVKVLKKDLRQTDESLGVDSPPLYLMSNLESVLRSARAGKGGKASNTGKKPSSLLTSKNSSSFGTTSASATAASTTTTFCSSNDKPEDECPSVASTATAHSVVSFEPFVTVHSIPARNEYSPHVRQNLWMNPQERQIAVSRNHREFIAEQWDWRKAVEEDDMVVCGDQLIHPVHIQPNPQQYFLQVFAAQQF